MNQITAITATASQRDLWNREYDVPRRGGRSGGRSRSLVARWLRRRG